MTNKAEVLSLEEGFEVLIDFDLTFVGEVHDSRLAHEAVSQQGTLLKILKIVILPLWSDKQGLISRGISTMWLAEG